MMIGIFGGLFGGCLFLICRFVCKIKYLKIEISLLPDPETLGTVQHPLIGIQISRVLDFPNHLQGQPSLVMIASPSCHSCSVELEAFIRLTKQQPIPFHCFVKNEAGLVDNFLDLYRHAVSMSVVESQIDMKLDIVESPFLFMVDEAGVVERVQKPMKLLISYYRKRVGL